MIIQGKIGRWFFIVLIVISVSLAGCFVGDKVIRPVKTNETPNTFKLSEENWGGNVIDVKVFDATYTEVLWHIEAMQEVPVKDFTITVGAIPTGFKQVVPSDNTQYTLHSGAKYVIVINANFKPPAWGGSQSWIAD